MATTIGRVYVPAPNPGTQRYGLFNVATGPLDLPTHARGGGLEYEVASCELPGGYDVACIDGGARTKDTTSTGWSDITANPFVVVASTVCSPVGSDVARAQRLAVGRLIDGEQAVVEDVFSRGTFGVSPSLANNASAVTITAATTIDAAFANLEAWLYARYGPRGVLHVPFSAMSLVMDHHLVWHDGQVWRTAAGTGVSFGNYSGLNAAGAAPAAGHTTLYITGEVAIWRSSDVFTPPYAQIINRTANTYFMPAEREYVISFDCFIAAIDLTL